MSWATHKKQLGISFRRDAQLKTGLYKPDIKSQNNLATEVVIHNAFRFNTQTVEHVNNSF